jgi:CubicO group peptidase (beta-lactamase class C family)
VFVISRLSALLLAAASIALVSAQAPASLPAHAAAQIEKLVAAEQARQKIPGVSIAIAFRNQPIYAKGFGLADVEHGVPVKTTTAFRTASIAKPFTAVAAMTLVEAGRLDLDAPVRTHCAAWPERHPPITTRQTLAHLSGIRHYAKPGEAAGKSHYFTIQDALALFKEDALLHAPGSTYHYSTYAYSVAGCVIEGVSGEPFEAFVRGRVLQPAGMTRTRVDRVYEIVPDRARGYQVLGQKEYESLPAAARSFAKAGELYNADLHDTSMKIPGGGFLSTAEDLVRFGIALNTGTLLKKDTVERMWTAQRTSDGKPTQYGLGFNVAPAQEGVRRISHGGNQAGAASLLVILPEVGVSYGIMTNRESADLGPISRGIATTLRETYLPRQ